MRIAVSIIALLMAGVLVVPSDCSVDRASWFDRYVSSPVRGAGSFISGAYHGAGDMWRSYSDMRKANTIGADKYFHARGNYDAAQRGPGGRWAAKVISNARESWQGGVSGRGAEDTQADQEANRWGRNGGNPNVYRPRGLGREY